MAKNKGWARVDRAVRDSWVWQDKPFAKGQAWIDLILRANHETRPVLIRGQLVTVEAGSMITSLRKLADEWGWNVKTVRHYLADLERDGMVHTMRTTNWTTITLVNWGKFQNQGNTERTSERTSERHTEGYTERTQTRNRTMNNKYTNPRARDPLGQFAISPGMRNDYTDMIAQLERENEERNRRDRLQGSSWGDEDGEEDY